MMENYAMMGWMMGAMMLCGLLVLVLLLVGIAALFKYFRRG